MPMNLIDLTGKTALVTGGNGGLGLGYATGLAKSGADVMIWGRNPDKNKAAVKQLEQYGGRVFAAQVDISSEEEVVAGMRDAVAKMGRLDCAVANAGILTRVDSFLNLTSEKYHKLLAASQHGNFFTLREAARHMAERSKAGGGGGSLIICGSLAVVRGVPSMEHYAAAKGALASMMRCIAVEFGPLDIRCNMILPGMYRTDMADKSDEPLKPDEVEFQERLFDSFKAATPLGRLGQTTDLEAACAFLASDASSFISGIELPVDGGWLAKLV